MGFDLTTVIMYNKHLLRIRDGANLIWSCDQYKRAANTWLSSYVFRLPGQKVIVNINNYRDVTNIRTRVPAVAYASFLSYTGGYDSKNKRYSGTTECDKRYVLKTDRKSKIFFKIQHRHRSVSDWKPKPRNSSDPSLFGTPLPRELRSRNRAVPTSRFARVRIRVLFEFACFKNN